MIGETIKDWKLVAKLGQGGMGEVWAAEQQIIKTRVAIKLLPAEVSKDTAQVERFFNEAVAVSKIKHAGIVRIFDVGFHDGRAFLIMELLEGETLRARIARAGRLSLGQVAGFGRQIASVLEATHGAGITHRDLKPDNVFVAPDAETGERVKLLDFGIAKLAGVTGATATGNSMGTPSYMAPELWSDAAKADARADIYALGCVVFDMVRGRPPFLAASIAEACTLHLSVAPPSLASGAAELDAIVAQMLAKAPADRPALAEISRVLAGLATGAPQALDATLPADADTIAPARSAQLPVITTLGAAAGAATVPPARRRPWLAIGLGGAAVAAAVAVVALRSSGTPDAPPPPPRPVVQPAPPPRVEPKLGLGMLETLRAPTPATVGSLRSVSAWTGAHDDLDAACKQPGAPVRWCAGAALAAGELAITNGDAAGAAVAFRAAAALEPAWAVPPFALASALSLTRDLDGALAAAHQAERLDPAWWQGPAAGARSFASAGRMPDAIQEYRRALSLAPKDPVLLSEVALAYHAAAMDAEADRYALAALAIDDSLVAVHLLRSERALEIDDARTALQEADRVLAVSPKNGAGHLARGDALALAQDKAGALAEYRQAIAIHDAIKGDSSMSDARLKLVQAAVAHDRLPPPRGKATAAGTDRSHPGCAAGDPLCSGASYE